MSHEGTGRKLNGKEALSKHFRHRIEFLNSLAERVGEQTLTLNSKFSVDLFVRLILLEEDCIA